ncbi:MAG TPA: hypothetical protein VHY10_17380 [Xanthobacteraceae bacterium]|nr:hypothetical protein [Xanthobacteraceae bacterium]
MVGAVDGGSRLGAFALRGDKRRLHAFEIDISLADRRFGSGKTFAQSGIVRRRQFDGSLQRMILIIAMHELFARQVELIVALGDLCRGGRYPGGERFHMPVQQPHCRGSFGELLLERGKIHRRRIAIGQEMYAAVAVNRRLLIRHSRRRDARCRNCRVRRPSAQRRLAGWWPLAVVGLC